eukprot:6200783-Pleurochrysis_carterae.AAC.2
MDQGSKEHEDEEKPDQGVELLVRRARSVALVGARHMLCALFRVRSGVAAGIGILARANATSSNTSHKSALRAAEHAIEVLEDALEDALAKPREEAARTAEGVSLYLLKLLLGHTLAVVGCVAFLFFMRYLRQRALQLVQRYIE